MTIEPKAVPQAIPSKASNSTATKPIRAAAPATKTTVRRSPVKRTTSVIKTTLDTLQATDKEVNADKSVKVGKVKMERDSFTMPKDEYAQLAVLKTRLLALGQPAKKSELLRAGIKQLAAMTDLRLKKAMADVPVIKTGRPKKKK